MPPVVLLARSGKVYEGALHEHLTVSGVSVVDCGAEFSAALDAAAFAAAEEELTPPTTVIVVDIANASAVRQIIDVLPIATAPLRVVVVTTLLTWCGQRISHGVIDAGAGFVDRVPLQAVLDTYALENELWKVAAEVEATGAIVCFAGVGLLYGQGGHDFEDVFKKLWGDAAAATSSSADGAGAIQLPFLDPNPQATNILAVHVDRFLTTVAQLAAAEGTFIPASSPIYVPVVDACRNAYNCASFDADQPLSGLARDDVLAMVSEQPQLMLFNAQVRPYLASIWPLSGPYLAPIWPLSGPYLTPI